MPIKGISYARVSSERQLAGEGLRRQLQAARDWIAANPEFNVSLDVELTDEARSAWKAEHTRQDSAFGTLLGLVRQGKIAAGSMLFVEALDRLSREEIWKANAQLSELVAAGIQVVTTKDGKIYNRQSNLADLILSLVKMDSAHQESELKSGRVRDTKAQRVKDAMITKHVLHQNVPRWLFVADAATSANRATRKYEFIERHAATVRLIYDMALDHGAAYITRHLTENKVEAFGHSGKWNIRYVKNILRSRAPLGHLESKHGLIENIFPKIIEDGLWLRVQAAADARKGSGGAKLGGNVNLLAGIGQCVHCGGKMRTNRHGRSRLTYYECTNRAVFGTCGNRCRYRLDILEKALIEHVGCLTVSARASRSPDIALLEANLKKSKEREQRLAKRLKELDDDDMFDLVMNQLRDLRADVSDATTALNSGRQTAAVEATPVTVTEITDRAALGTALKRLLKAAYFDDDHEIGILSKGGLLLMVTARENAAAARILLLRQDGKLAIIQNGRLSIGDAPQALIDAGMTSLDVCTVEDLIRALAIQPDSSPLEFSP